MKEAVFVHKNLEKWKSIERNLSSLNNLAADELADLYVEVTSDLSFAQSHYPDSRIAEYLNNLAAKLHTAVYGKRSTSLFGLISFWIDTVPRIVWDSRKSLLISFFVFALSTLVGVLYELDNPDYAREIMGDGYVNMTLDNIAKGKPTDVYSSGSEMSMFLMITLNNVRVAFHTFVYGLLSFLGAGYILVNNGIMLGSFQTFFFIHGVGFESMLSIWIHGTLEISAIIIAGGAGMELGKGWLLPGTYSRKKAFLTSAGRGVRLMIATVPMFFIAAFFEGYVTRHAEWPDLVKLGFILASLAFVVYYYVVLPVRKSGKSFKEHFENLSKRLNVWKD